MPEALRLAEGLGFPFDFEQRFEESPICTRIRRQTPRLIGDLADQAGAHRSQLFRPTFRNDAGSYDCVFGALERQFGGETPEPCLRQRMLRRRCAKEQRVGPFRLAHHVRRSATDHQGHLLVDRIDLLEYRRIEERLCEPIRLFRIPGKGCGGGLVQHRRPFHNVERIRGCGVARGQLRPRRACCQED